MVEINPGHGNQRGDGKEPEKNDGLSAPVDTNSPLRPRHTKKVRAEHLQENQPVSQPFTLANPMAEPVINTVPFSTSSTSSGSSAESKRKDKKRTHEGQSVSELSFFEVSDSSIPPGPFSGASSASSASRVQPVDLKKRKTRKSASNKKKKVLHTCLDHAGAREEGVWINPNANARASVTSSADVKCSTLATQQTKRHQRNQRLHPIFQSPCRTQRWTLSIERRSIYNRIQ